MELRKLNLPDESWTRIKDHLRQNASWTQCRRRRDARESGASRLFLVLALSLLSRAWTQFAITPRPAWLTEKISVTFEKEGRKQLGLTVGFAINNADLWWAWKLWAEKLAAGFRSFYCVLFEMLHKMIFFFLNRTQMFTALKKKKSFSNTSCWCTCSFPGCHRNSASQKLKLNKNNHYAA